MNSTTYVGNLTRDPELRFSADGKPRATFTVAVNEGTGDKEKTHFVDATAFGTLGENVATSLAKGMRVVVVGRIDTYKREVTIDGTEKALTMVKFIASEVSPSLHWAQAKVTKVYREDGGQGNGNGGPSAQDSAATSTPSASGNGSARSGSTVEPTAARTESQDDLF